MSLGKDWTNEVVIMGVTLSMYVSPPRPDTVDLVTSGRLKYVWRRHVNEKDSASAPKHEGNFQCQETVFAIIDWH